MLWLLLAHPAAALSSDGVWSSLFPVSRVHHSAIYDPVRDRMLICGGYAQGAGGALSADLWAFSFGGSPAWRAVPAVGEEPPSLMLHSAIYDPVGDRMVVFGRGGIYGGHEVWTLNLSGEPAWTRLEPLGTPPPDRYATLAVYDPIRHRMVIFGGIHAAPNEPYETLNDVWALSLGDTPEWTPIVAAGPAPTPRYYHHQGGIYDPLGDRLIVFAGNTLSSIYLHDVWALNLDGAPAWTELTPLDGPPPERTMHSAVFDANHHRMLVFGGLRGSGPLNDVWALSLEGTPTWTPLDPEGTPPNPRYGHTAIYDPLRDRMVVWGQADSGDPAAWSLSLDGAPAWSMLEPENFPALRADAVTVHDPVRQRIVVFGGSIPWTPGSTNDLWMLSLENPGGWNPLAPSGTPPMRRYAGAGVYDPARDRILIYGGWTPAPDEAVWSLALAPELQWGVLPTGGTSPGARIGHSLVYDTRRDRLLLYGGWNLNDLWALSLAGSPPVWEPLAPEDPPPAPPSSHTAFYDEPRDRMLMFGRMGGIIEVWALSPGPPLTWRRLASAGTPPPGRDAFTTVFDAPRNRVLLFGGVIWAGINPTAGPHDDVWAFDLEGDGAWSQPGVTGAPAPALWGHGAVYDGPRDRMVVFGGLTDSYGAFTSVTAAFQLQGLVTVQPAGPAVAIALRAHPNPASPALDVSFTLTSREPARLEILDVAGRRIAAREVGAFGPGSHVVAMGSDSRVPPGLYLLRLTQEGRTVSSKAVVIP